MSTTTRSLKQFIKRYLKLFCWVQLPLEVVKEMEENEEIEGGLGHRYQDPETQLDMVESHVDDPFFFKPVWQQQNMEAS
jgi:hypothetical protein